jgi:hypothetical protein
VLAPSITGLQLSLDLAFELTTKQVSQFYELKPAPQVCSTQ